MNTVIEKPKWEVDKDWSDRFVPEIKTIIGQHLTKIEEANEEEDTQHNTDLVVLKTGDIRIACRIRTHPYYLQYPGDFTIRCSRPETANTELAKVLAGWGDYMFYGFANKDDTGLIAWTLCDLDAFRKYFKNYYKVHNSLPGIVRHNNDNSSDFRVFRWQDCPKSLVIARS